MIHCLVSASRMHKASPRCTADDLGQCFVIAKSIGSQVRQSHAKGIAFGSNVEPKNLKAYRVVHAWFQI